MLVLAAGTFSAWTTNKASHTAQEFHHVVGTGAIAGTGTVLGKGTRFLSIAEVVAGTDESLIYVESDDLVSSPDTVIVGASGIEMEFPHGLDSASVIVLAAGAELGIHSSN